MLETLKTGLPLFRVTVLGGRPAPWKTPPKVPQLAVLEAAVMGVIDGGDGGGGGPAARCSRAVGMQVRTARPSHRSRYARGYAVSKNARFEGGGRVSVIDCSHLVVAAAVMGSLMRPRCRRC